MASRPRSAPRQVRPRAVSAASTWVGTCPSLPSSETARRELGGELVAGQAAPVEQLARMGQGRLDQRLGDAQVPPPGPVVPFHHRAVERRHPPQVLGRDQVHGRPHQPGPDHAPLVLDRVDHGGLVDGGSTGRARRAWPRRRPAPAGRRRPRPRPPPWRRRTGRRGPAGSSARSGNPPGQSFRLGQAARAARPAIGSPDDGSIGDGSGAELTGPFGRNDCDLLGVGCPRG